MARVRRGRCASRRADASGPAAPEDVRRIRGVQRGGQSGSADGGPRTSPAAAAGYVVVGSSWRHGGWRQPPGAAVSGAGRPRQAAQGGPVGQPPGVRFRRRGGRQVAAARPFHVAPGPVEGLGGWLTASEMARRPTGGFAGTVQILCTKCATVPSWRRRGRVHAGDKSPQESRPVGAAGSSAGAYSGARRRLHNWL